MAEPAELVDPRTDCGNDWTRLTSKPVRRMQVLITACMFFGGTALLSIVVLLPWTDPTPRTIAFVMWVLWALLTGIAFVASLVLWLAEEPELLLSRRSIVGGQPVALRWRLPAGMKKRTLRIELCGQEEWTHVLREDTQAELYRFLTLPRGVASFQTSYLQRLQASTCARSAFAKPMARRRCECGMQRPSDGRSPITSHFSRFRTILPPIPRSSSTALRRWLNRARRRVLLR